MELSHYTIDELVELRDEINNRIYSYEDGYIYICKCRSYGLETSYFKFWTDNHIKNTHTLQELLYKYDGEDGIVDVYSTNPDLSNIHNYGGLKHIKSVDDYHQWYKYERLKRDIPEYENEWEEWDDRENVPGEFPYTAPIHSKEDIKIMKKELEEFDMSFTPPQRYTQDDEQE
jgi:hypothetical protein